MSRSASGACLALSVTISASAQSALPGRLDVQLYAAMLRATDGRIADSALFTRGITSSDPRIRRVAAKSVAQLALSRRAFAVAMLRPLLADRDGSVVASAAFGLGLSKDTASVERLAVTVKSPSVASSVAAWALGEIGKPASQTLATLLGKSPSRTSVVSALLIAESKIKPLDFVAVRPYLASKNAGVRWAAAYAIARGRHPAGARALLVARGDAAFDAEVARELSASTAGDSLHDVALARVRMLLAHADPHVRIQAVRSVATYGVVARADVARAMHDEDANVRVTAAQSAALPFAHDTASWVAAWAADSGYMFRQSLVASATTARYPLPGAAGWGKSGDWRLRADAINAFAGSHDTTAMRAAVLGGANDSDGRVRAAAYGLLASIDTTARDSAVQAVLVRAMTDPDTLARQASPRFKQSRDTIAPSPRPMEWYESIVRTLVIHSLAGHAPRATIHTSRGDVVMRLYGAETPLTVENFISLAARKYYDGARFHRVVPAFVAQDGDPRGDGNGGPGYAIRDELTQLPYSRGALGMALSGPDTGGSQYFLTLTPQPHLDGHYTVFGMVVSGLGVMDALVQGDAITSITVQH